MTLRLRHLVELGPRPKMPLPDDLEVSFAPMDSIKDGLGGLSALEAKPAVEVASGSYNYFEDGDVLLAKVTPCFENGKKALASELQNGVGFATSEVHVIRPKPGRIVPRFLLYLLSSEKFRAEGMASMTGAGGLRRVGELAILNHRPAVTDLPAQKAIADFLDRETARIDLLIEKKQRLIGVTHARFAAFREECLVEGRSTRLKHLANYVTSGSRDWGDRYSETGDLFVRIGNISGPSIDLDLSSRTFVNLGTRTEGQRTRLVENDLLISITANLGAVAVVGPEAVGGYINQHVALVRLTRPELARFVAYSLQTRKAFDEFQLRGYGGTKQGLSLSDIREVRILLPVDLNGCLQLIEKLDRHWSRTLQIMQAVFQSIDRLREFRAALITAAVTGQIDPETWSRRGTTDRRLDQIEAEMGA